MKARESVVAGKGMPVGKRAIAFAFLFWIPGAQIGITCSHYIYPLTCPFGIKHTCLLLSIYCKKSLTLHLAEDEKFIVFKIQAFMYSTNKSCYHVPFPFSRSYTSFRIE